MCTSRHAFQVWHNSNAIPVQPYGITPSKAHNGLHYLATNTHCNSQLWSSVWLVFVLNLCKVTWNTGGTAAWGPCGCISIFMVWKVVSCTPLETNKRHSFFKIPLNWTNLHKYKPILTPLHNQASKWLMECSAVSVTWTQVMPVHLTLFV